VKGQIKPTKTKQRGKYENEPNENQIQIGL
jgi:hypothetical protein